MAGPVYRIDGLNRFVTTMRRAGADMEDMKVANAKAAAIVAAAANARAPRRTGRLAGSIRGARQARRVVVRAGSAAIPYAGPIHWGWPARHIAPNPFLVNAAHETEPTWLPQYKADLVNIVRKVQGA